MAGIRDVAKEAGVAICTVSRLLNGTANVEPETRKKIEDAMKKLNYVPNELEGECLRADPIPLPCLCRIFNIRGFLPWHRRLRRYCLRKSTDLCCSVHLMIHRGKKTVLRC